MINQFIEQERLRYIPQHELSFAIVENMPFDSFEIVEKNRRFFITGQSQRACLYGLYTLIQQQNQQAFVTLDKPSTVYYETNFEQAKCYVPKVKRRGNVFETINDRQFIVQMIDTGVKNGLNEFFFTFFLWEELAPHILDELQKRGVHVTLGGHSLRFLLARAQGQYTSKDAIDGAINDLIGVKTDFTMENKIGNVHFLNNPDLQRRVIEQVVLYCKQYEIVTRISLWPEDISVKGLEAQQFLPLYMEFSEKLQRALTDEQCHVAVEHIVYNAGLCWEMLERNTHEVSQHLNILHAYWGRNYTEYYENKPDRRAYKALLDWKSQSEQQVTIFEYYSDHFMLSELFPPLWHRIQQDVDSYALANDGILNLVVPLHRDTAKADHLENYDYQQIQQYNNFIFCRSMWEGFELQPLEILLRANGNPQLTTELIYEVEQAIATHSKYNSILFPSRVVEGKPSSFAVEIMKDLKRMDEVLQRVTQLNQGDFLCHYFEQLQLVVKHSLIKWGEQVV